MYTSEKWEVKLDSTQFDCHAVSPPCPKLATSALYLGDNIWILALKDKTYLKMVKIKVTGEETYQWIEAMYNREGDYDPACDTNFQESCYVHMPKEPDWDKPKKDESYKIILSADRMSDKRERQLLGKGK